jgi:heme-degrading monooxygenase HmoA
MEPRAYTVARWRVTPGQEAAFRAAWKDLAHAFAGLNRPPFSGTLLQHHSDPTLFVSFGPWNSLEDIEVMRRDETAQDAFLRVVALCDEAEPGTFRAVERVTLRADVPADVASATRMRRMPRRPRVGKRKAG